MTRIRECVGSLTMPQAHLTSKDPTLQTGNERSGKRPEVTQAAVSRCDTYAS